MPGLTPDRRFQPLMAVGWEEIVPMIVREGLGRQINQKGQAHKPDLFDAI